MAKTQAARRRVRNKKTALAIVLAISLFNVGLPCRASADATQQAAKFKELGDTACDDKNFSAAVAAYTTLSACSATKPA